MPSPTPSVRPVLAALLTALLLVLAVPTGLPVSLVGTAQAAPPRQEPGAPVHLDLVELSPTSLAPDGVLEAQVEVTNTSSKPLTDVDLELRTRTPRVTDRALLAQWQEDTQPDAVGAPVATSAAHTIQPGESTVLTVRTSAKKLGYSPEPYFWGTRRVSLTVVSEDRPLAALRSFVVWRPADAEEEITQSVLLPVTSADDVPLAIRPEVDWWLDPALLEAPARAMDPTTPSDGGGAQETADPLGTVTYAPDPAAATAAEELTAAAPGRTILARPYAQADLVSLQQAGTGPLTAAVQQADAQVRDQLEADLTGPTTGLPAASATADLIDAQIRAGAKALVLPSAVLRADPASNTTPSSIGQYTSEAGSVPVIAPDPELSTEFTLLTAEADTEQIRQRLLAETATIASEYTDSPRHLVIAPSAEAGLDTQAAEQVLEAMQEAPWIRAGRTDALLEAAQQETWTTSPLGDEEHLLALGELGPADVQAAAPAPQGRWQHVDARPGPSPLDPQRLQALSRAQQDLTALAEVMEDQTALEEPQWQILDGLARRWRTDPQGHADHVEDVLADAATLRGEIAVVPASGYNVISDTAGVPITITNRLDTPITVRPLVTSDKPLVSIAPSDPVVVPAGGQVDVTVEVDAIANGSVTLTTVVATADGRPLSEPVSTPLTVNPSWENWTTLLLVIAMGVLVVVGVLRARRVGSTTRAPGVAGPEDPEELARSGRSTPDTHSKETR